MYMNSQSLFLIFAAFAALANAQVTVWMNVRNASSSNLSFEVGWNVTIVSNTRIMYSGACPAGRFCPLFTGWPLVCPLGTFRNTTGQATVCTGLCPVNNYCVDPRVAVQCPTFFKSELGSFSLANCTALQTFAWIRVNNASNASFAPDTNWTMTSFANTLRAYQFECPVGFYCPLYSTRPTLCPNGTFSNTTRLSTICPLCAANSYCITPIVRQQCPTFFRSDAGSSAFANCVMVNAVVWVNIRNASTPRPVFFIGWSVSVVSNAMQVYSFECPAGRYCPQNSTAPLVCPSGTFSNTTRRSTICTSLCPVNFFCSDPGIREACPANTRSNAGSVSKLSCSCNGGYLCKYQKTVSTSLILYIPIEIWVQNNTLQILIMQAVAKAAGVLTTQVSMQQAAPLWDNGNTRRLLSKGQGLMEVIFKINHPDTSYMRRKIMRLNNKEDLDASVRDSIWHMRRVSEERENLTVSKKTLIADWIHKTMNRRKMEKYF